MLGRAGASTLRLGVLPTAPLHHERCPTSRGWRPALRYLWVSGIEMYRAGHSIDFAIDAAARARVLDPLSVLAPRAHARAACAHAYATANSQPVALSPSVVVRLIASAPASAGRVERSPVGPSSVLRWRRSPLPVPPASEWPAIPFPCAGDPRWPARSDHLPFP